MNEMWQLVALYIMIAMGILAVAMTFIAIAALFV